MTKNKKILAIIPARGGSKRLPRKNILPLAGKPLIAWTIEAAIKSDIFDEVMVNTDNQEIADVAEKFGAKVPFMRPEHLASDTASSLDVIKHTLLWYRDKGVHFTDVVLLQPSSPLRNEHDIIGAWQQYITSNGESVVSVCPVEHPIQWTYKLHNDSSLSCLFDDDGKRSQDYEDNYRLNGAIYITKTSVILEKNEIMSSQRNCAYVMEAYGSVDIDTVIDFDYASFLLQRNK
ncbi:cytidylyltransferase domain-containing protein [Psychromonas hadalis]|uniref:acylneuraminate cytidylyltransferase family protein n=1 Tax=Psychromonas hadalis TaxID=211669 RepID=UPI0003B58858|nr:acylneuraminate cytidylyltransferase family protein [Psychromonas hadalis]